VGLRTGLDGVEKKRFLTLPGPELRPLSRPASSQSLYRLRYPCSPLLLRTSYINIAIWNVQLIHILDFTGWLMVNKIAKNILIN
jgi:hypothetical protein